MAISCINYCTHRSAGHNTHLSHLVFMFGLYASDASYLREATKPQGLDWLSGFLRLYKWRLVTMAMAMVNNVIMTVAVFDDRLLLIGSWSRPYALNDGNVQSEVGGIGDNDKGT